MIKKILLLIAAFSLALQMRVGATHAVGADLTYTCLGGNKYKITYTFYRDCQGNSGALPTPSQDTVRVSIEPKCGGSICTKVTPRLDTVWTLNYPACNIDTTFPCSGSAIGIDAVTNQKNTSNTVHSVTWSHTIGNYANRLLVVGVSLEQTGSSDIVDSITYGGVKLAYKGSVGGSATRSELWYLPNPAVGTANITVYTRTTINSYFTCGATSYYNVNQATPLGGTTSLTNTGTAPSLTFPSAPGELVIDVLAAGGPAQAVNAGAGQTTLWDIPNTINGAGSRKGGAASVTMSWNFATSRNWSMTVTSVKPAGACNSTDTTYTYSSGCYRIDTVGWDTTAVPCPGKLWVTLNKVFGTGQEVTPICLTSKSTCQGGAINGIRAYVFEGIVELPFQCDDWVISDSVWARNNSISSIQNPGSQLLYIEAHLNNKNALCNSSPSFSNRPVPFTCVGQKYCFNHGAIDIDGDSLVYQIIAPKTGPSSSVTYIGGHSVSQPVLSNPPLTFDSSTGDICMVPAQQEVTVLAVLVKEYRNGILIGSVIRDMQVNVLNCNNQLPYLNGINNTGKFDTVACAGVPLCFDIPSFDADPGHTLTIDWNQGIPGGTFTSSGGNRPQGTFCWTPDASDASPSPYCFTVEIKDDNCPLNGNQIYSFCIKVAGATVDLGPDTAACNAGSVVLDAGAGPYTYSWSTGATTQKVTVNTSGIYYVTVNGGGCIVRDTIKVIVGSPYVNLGPDIVRCAGDSIILDAGYGPYIYQWFPGNETTQKITVKNSGTYIVSVDNGGGCTKTDTINITINPFATAAVRPDTSICAKTSVQLWATGGTSYSWDPITTLSDPFLSNPVATPSVTTHYRVVAYGTGGCNDTASVKITVDSSVAIAATDTTVCPGSAIQLVANGGGTYNWLPPGGLSCTACPNPVAMIDSTTKFIVRATYTSGCTSEDSVIISAYKRPVINPGAGALICQGDTANLSVTGTGTFTWSPSSGLSCINCPNPKASPPSKTTYVVTLLDTSLSGNGCTNSDSLTVDVITPPMAIAGTDTSICQDGSISVTLTGSGGTDYSWYSLPSLILLCNNCPSTTVTPTTTQNYMLIASNGICSDTDSVTVNVISQPVARANSGNDTTICQGSSITLTGSGGSSFTWSSLAPPAVICSNCTSTTVAPVSTQSYIVTAFDGTCSSNDTIAVNVIPMPQAIAGADTVICSGGSVTLNGNGGTSGYWSSLPGPVFLTNSPAITVNPPSTRSYIFVAATAGCSDTDTVIVNVLPQPTILANSGNDTSICLGSSIVLTASGGATYTWNGPGGIICTNCISTPPQSPVSTALYVVTGSNGVCSDQDSLTVSVSPPPIASLEGPDFACARSEGIVRFTGTSSPGASFTWSYNESILVSGSGQGPYYFSWNKPGTKMIRVTVSDRDCPSQSDSIYVLVKGCEIRVPNIMTPNDDGPNDYFHIKDLEYWPNTYLVIYNRWGMKLYESADYKNNWDATTASGTKVPDGVYYYLLKLTNGETYNGFFTVLKNERR